MHRDKRKATSLLIALGFSFAAIGPAAAVNKNWDDGGANKNWSNGFNWSGNTVPLNGDDVFIGNLAAAEFDIVVLDISDPRFPI